MRMKIGSRIDSVRDVGHAFVLAATAMQVPVSLALKKTDGLDVQAGDRIQYAVDIKEDSLTFLDEEVELFRNGERYATARFNFG